MHLIQNVIMLALGWHSVVFKLSTNRHTWYMTLWCSSGRLTTHMLQPIMPNFSCTSALPHPLLECCSAVLWWGWPKCQNVKMSLSHERVIGKVVQNRCEKSLALCSVEKRKKRPDFAESGSWTWDHFVHFGPLFFSHPPDVDGMSAGNARRYRRQFPLIFLM